MKKNIDEILLDRRREKKIKINTITSEKTIKCVYKNSAKHYKVREKYEY